jgi:hypothetical protein
LEGSKCGYGGQLPKDDFGYGLTPNPEEAFSPQTEQVDKDMMIFINSWKLLLCEQELYGKVTDLVTSDSSRGKISLFDNKFNLGTVNTDAKGNYTFLWNAEKLIM